MKRRPTTREGRIILDKPVRGYVLGLPVDHVPMDGKVHHVALTRRSRRWLPGYATRIYVDSERAPDSRPLLQRVLGR